MAEPTLSLTYTDLTEAVGHFLGYGGTTANWSADQTAEIDDIVQSG